MHALTPGRPGLPFGTSLLACVVSTLVASLGVAAVPACARAQSVERAGELYLGADFEGARREARRVALAATTSREDLIDALRLLVSLETILGQPARAEEAARLLVLLDPTAEPAAGAPEEAAATVAAARTAPRPSVVVRFSDGVATATTDAPPIGARLALDCVDAAGSHAVEGEPTLPLRQPLDTTQQARCRAQIRTPGGVVIVEATGSVRPDGVAVAGRGGGGGGAQAGIDEQTLWVVLGVGGGVVLTALVVGIAVAASSGDRDATFAAPVVIGF
ncbi:MAG: hypothetical protein OHK0013_13950 [Sandaracinaceae bacterium]